MSETHMPAAEVNNQAYTDEVRSYEFAFHILPTVAEGEVPGVLAVIKDAITQHEGVIFDEESPERIDLVYPIVKRLEGKNRRFESAYFGWIRFRSSTEAYLAIEEALRGVSATLRSLTIRLTKEEETSPFRFHEHRVALKQIEFVDEEALAIESPTDMEQTAPVVEEALDASLEKITHEGDNSTIEEKV